MSQKTIAIIGAGIVGVSSAIWLQRAGHRVILIDREGPASGTSYGNAGLLASSSVVPVTVPGLIAKVPKMLFDPESPLFLRWGYLPRLLPWLARYLYHATPERCAKIASGLTEILYDSVEQHQALAKGTEAEKFIQISDYIYGYASREAFEAERFTWDLRRQFGFTWEEMDRDAFAAYDPAFQGEIGFAVRLPDHGFIRDPGAYVKALAQQIQQDGGEFIQAEVLDFEQNEQGVSGLITNKGPVACDHFVLATGAWSGALTKKLGLKIPLESERGYHIELVNPSVVPRAPVMITSGKFVTTPMEGRLRCAGIVEFGGLKSPASEKPFALLKKKIHAALPGITYDRIDEWMGHRPATSDSLPCIGAFAGVPGAYAAFGHQHVGLTGGPKTGKLIADLISDERSNVDLTPYRLDRFR